MKDVDIQNFSAADGFNLTYRCWNSLKSIKRVIVCIHGIGDHSGWFRNLGPELAVDGNQVYALDLRGFGNSKEEGLPKGCVSDFEQHLQDIDDFIVYLRVVHKGKKLFILGHSLGGVYALWYAALHSATIDGLVLAAPPITSAFSNRKNAITISIKNAIIPRRTHNPYTSSNAKNRDPEEIEIMLKDPLETPQLTVNYLANVKNRLLKVALRNASLIQAPTLILQGEIDTTVLGTGAKKLYAKLNAKDKKLELFPDAGHWFYDVLSPVSPRAKYTPAKREQFIVVIKAWLKNH